MPDFNLTRCDFPPIEPIPNLPIINDCGIPGPAPQIRDCPDIFLPVPGTPGAPGTGTQGPPGPTGPPGPQNPLYILRRCFDPKHPDFSEVLFVNNNLAEYIGDTVKLINGFCYEVEEYTPPDPDDELEGVNITVYGVWVQIIEIYLTCARCNGPCWELTKCLDDTVSYTRTDLAAYEDKWVKLNDGYCYAVALAETADCEDPAPVVVSGGPFYDCDSCDTCWQLENCHDAGDTLVLSYDLETLFDELAAAIISNERVVVVNGRCYKVTANTACVSEVSPEDLTTHPDCSECPCYLMVPCAGESGFPVVAHAATYLGEPFNLGDQIGKSVRLSDGICYSVSAAETCDDSVSVSLLSYCDECDDCQCYELIPLSDPDCSDETAILTYSDLSGYSIGDIVQEEGSDPVKCYRIAGIEPWTIDAVAFVPFGSFSSCESCYKQKQYKLEQSCSHSSCEDDEDAEEGADIITEEDMGAAVGQYVKVRGSCYLVSEVTGEVVTDETLDFDGPFETCSDCSSSPISSTIPPIDSIELTETELIYHINTLIVENGLIVGVCKKKVTVEVTPDCPEEE